MSEWIKCSERLPESAPGTWSKPVIALSDAELVFKLSYYNGDECASGCWQRTRAFADSDSSKVTHWMPMPNAPEAE